MSNGSKITEIRQEGVPVSEYRKDAQGQIVVFDELTPEEPEKTFSWMYGIPIEVTK